MLWYYYGKNIPTQQLPAFEILEEWYALCEEEGLTHVRTHRAVRGSNTSSGAGGSSSGVGGGVGGGSSSVGDSSSSPQRRSPRVAEKRARTADDDDR